MPDSVVGADAMPEGDTIHKLARALAPGLIGQRPRSIVLARRHHGTAPSGRIGAVYARGKHLFIEFDHGEAIRTHLGMYGSWHRYAPAEPWRKPERQASLVLKTDLAIYVCFNAREVEVLRVGGLRDQALRARLALDLLAEEVPFDQIPRKARAFCDPETPIVDVLLDQRIACGIGNVYKSEVLFLQACHPSTPLHQISDQALLGLYRCAAELLRRNLGPGPRVTRADQNAASRLWVYRRVGQTCQRCGTRICAARLGRHWRSTYWCPGCQPLRAPTAD